MTRGWVPAALAVRVSLLVCSESMVTQVTKGRPLLSPEAPHGGLLGPSAGGGGVGGVASVGGSLFTNSNPFVPRVAGAGHVPKGLFGCLSEGQGPPGSTSL